MVGNLLNNQRKRHYPRERFYEGGSSSLLTHQVKKCVQSGIKVLGLAALDSTATPCYDRDTAQALVNVGAQIAAMTPGELASWIAENLQS
ncbi:von Willebrand factor type A domain protein YehP [Escherichia coli]|uniref:von Willebrand factor type A domain protein YehP n=1 Tax=Escherichia coli TaxID=562 RepID=A0A376Y8B0_ECOLX|nr:von Willebrand factor type A domain protein YehP [Escherichia coli]